MSNEAPTDALRLVPVEPTEAMHYEGDRVLANAVSNGGSIFDTTKAIYRAMLSAAPASPLPGGGDEALIAELKMTQGLLSQARGFLSVDPNGIAMLDRINAFLARNGKADLQKMQNNTPRNAPRGLSDEC